jgi:hypothetical protein
MEQIPTWLLTLMVTGLAASIGSTVAAYVILVQRITRVETIISMWNTKSAEILHSPHTPELDALLEKFVKSYKEKHYDLTMEEWQGLQKMTCALENDQTLAKGERMLAAMVNATCEHKLMRYRKPTE